MRTTTKEKKPEEAIAKIKHNNFAIKVI